MMPRQEFVMLVIVAIVCLIAAFLFSGCASPDPPAPIQAYRAQYGFN